MADINQFGSAKPGASGDDQACAQCEAMFVDAIDSGLSPKDQAFFDLHVADCHDCANLYADTKRGASWMEMLKSPEPEPSDDLLKRIFNQTSDLTDSQTIPSRTILPSTPSYIRNPNTLLGQPMLAPSSASRAATPSNILPFRSRITHSLRSIGHTMLQPRLAMTAAMAFFSIALTLNLTGVRLSNLRASDFKPSSILRGCYETKARVVRYSDNLRVVYELESRVRDLQHSSDDGFTGNPTPQEEHQTPSSSPEPDTQKPAEKNQDQDRKQSRPNPGSSQRQAPAGNMLHVQYSGRSGMSPLSPHISEIVAPSIFKKQEGGLV